MCIDIRFNIDFMMTLDNHGYLFKCSISGTFTNTINGHFHLTGTVQNSGYRISSGHTQIIMAMCRQDRFLNTRHMLHQIFDFRTVFRGQAIAGCIRNIHYSSPCLNNGFNHTGQILIIRTAGILRIKLYIIHKATGIFHCCYRTLDNLFTVRIKFILDMRIRCTDSCMDTFTLGKFQSIHRHINILLHRTCQSTNRGPCHRFRNFDY